MLIIYSNLSAWLLFNQLEIAGLITHYNVIHWYDNEFSNSEEYVTYC